jgi:hypothetical protein
MIAWTELSFTQRLLIGSMVLLTLLRWAMGAVLELSPPEALLAEWGRHPSLAGLPGGFGTAFFSWISTQFAGWTPFGVRFFAPLLAVLGSWVLYRMVSSLAGEKAAAWSVALLNLTPAWNQAAVFLMPEMPGMVFMLCGMAAVWRALRRASAWDWHWPLAGMLFGCGFLCWYGALWGAVSTLVLLAASRRWRRQWLRPGPWLMLADTVLFIRPVWQWNEENAFAGWFHLMEHLRPAHGGSLLGPLQLGAGWMLALTPLILAAMAWAVWMGLRRWGGSDTARFFTAYAVTPLAGTLAAAVWGGSHPLWIAPALPALCGLLPWAWEQVITERLEWKQRFQWLTVLPALIMTPLLMDTKVLRHAGFQLSVAAGPSREWRGWRTASTELTRVIHEAAATAEQDAKGGRKLFLIAESQRLASILNFYLSRQLPVRWPTPGHPLVHTVESALIENIYHTWPRYDYVREGRSRFAGCTALYITDSPGDSDPPPNVTRAFRTVRPLALFDIMTDGQSLRRVRVFACYQYGGIPE